MAFADLEKLLTRLLEEATAEQLRTNGMGYQEPSDVHYSVPSNSDLRLYCTRITQ